MRSARMSVRDRAMREARYGLREAGKRKALDWCAIDRGIGRIMRNAGHATPVSSR